VKRIAFLALVAGVAALSLFILRTNSSSAPDFPTVAIVAQLPEVTLDIPTGASGSDIARLLFENGVVKSSDAFFRVAVGDKRSEKIAPGAHRLSQKISAAQALEQLLDPKRIPNLIRVAEGAWKSEVIDSLIEYGFARSEVASALNSAVLPKGFKDAEGLLFPAQYTFAKGTSAAQAVQAMVDRFLKEPISTELLRGDAKFTPRQLLTIASIIQAESVDKDFKRVSAVIRNRLAIGMPLQMDSTVHFVMKARGDIFLSTKSTLINSPYNTYKRYGLPPGPIGNPGTAAMQAALAPDVGNWLFFITVSPGDTRFTESFTEFNEWKALYQKNRKAGMFK
jgi:UPF0755 protein